MNDPSDGNEAGVSEVKDGDVEETAIIENNSASVNHESLSVEKKAMKLVGLVALEALDTCIAEFGKANPVLMISVRVYFLLSLQINTRPMSSMILIMAERRRLIWIKTRNITYQTWVEDSHFAQKLQWSCGMQNWSMI